MDARNAHNSLERNTITTKQLVITEPQAVVDNHDTLKYHLLGPSLTKAGQDSVDQIKVSRAERLRKVKVLTTATLRFRRSSTMLRKAQNSLITRRSKTAI